MSDDTDNVLAERRDIERASTFRRTGGQDGGYEPTPDELAAQERAAFARILKVWNGPATEDGRMVVSDAIGEAFGSPQLREIAEVLHAHYANPDSEKPDDCELGRLFRALIHAHVQSIVEGKS